jgi:hypothetical protein
MAYCMPAGARRTAVRFSCAGFMIAIGDRPLHRVIDVPPQFSAST